MKQGPLFLIAERLRRPYVLNSRVASRWRTCGFSGLFVFLFLFIFRPFGLNEVPEGIFTISLGYGLTTFGMMAFLNIALLPVFPAFFSEEAWTVGREMAWATVNIALIGLANLLYSRTLHFFSFSFAALWMMEGFTLAIGIFPITASILAKEARLKKKYARGSEAINHTLTEKSSAPVLTTGLITLLSENAGDDLILGPGDLLYIRSADNYLEVFFTRGQVVERKLIRNSLKAVSESVQGHPYLFRCHKSYLVNLKQVNHVSGNAQGYKLHLRGLDVLIPVSRQWNDEVKSRLSGAS